MEEGLVVLNEGKTATRMGRSTQNHTSPDLTLSTEGVDNVSWTVLNKLGSDHLPIIISIQKQNRKTKSAPILFKWQLSNIQWEDFAEWMEKALPEHYNDEDKVGNNTAIFNKAVQKGLSMSTKRVKVGTRKVEVWWNKKVDDAVRTRDNLAAEGKRNTEEWLEANEETRKVIAMEKKTCWKDFVNAVDTTTDTAEVWRIIKMLRGTTEQHNNKVIEHNGRMLITDKQKANGFIDHYAKVSKERMTKEELRMRKDASNEMKGIQTSPEDNDYTKDFTINELNEAITLIDETKAGGPDEIPPIVLKHYHKRPNCSS